MESSTPPDTIPEDDSNAILEEDSWSLENTPKSSSGVNNRKSDEIYNPYQSDTYQSDDIILLERMCRMGYFDGGHHLEEIMYLENIRRSQLLQILDKFRDVLITSEHEDPAMALFYSEPPSR